ncbi:MAG: 3-hydroxyacyl-CoA dehydrogenase family protein [Trinickia sp.]|jgi:3-hydroxyacyl-CoA dehydrogenase|uniref:3-hydroxyacyl-CoA dehydrogenase family protein n=1 Tax=Trinickia sp. TaxID=2571163 RepID=UPI003F819F7E
MAGPARDPIAEIEASMKFDRAFGDDEYRPAPMLRERVSAGYGGRKAKRGFYFY